MTSVVVQEIVNTIIVGDGPAVAVVEEVVSVVSVAEQGPAGPPGAGTITRVAGEAIGGHRLVCADDSGAAVYADSDSADQAFRLLGLSTGAAVEGADLPILVGGEITELSWSWDTSKPLYLGTGGAIAQDPPVTGVSVVVGFPLTPTSAFISIGEPVVLS